MPEPSGSHGGSNGDLNGSLRRAGLLAESGKAHWTALTGGVSSDIWRVDLPGRTVCVKRARPVLAVAAHWEAPVERNASEVAWLEAAAEVSADSVPQVIAHIADANLFVMEFLDPAQFPVWKQELSGGRVNPQFAASVGAFLGDVHARTAGDEAISVRFANDDLFHSLRLEPYLEATAAAHPALAQQLRDLADRTATTKLALVHGDVSPKNLLVGPKGPVLLDAECAWYGDPAFDVAFCLTHLLLKCHWVPAAQERLLDCFDAFVEAHLGRVDWEPRADLDARVATLLPALLLARVDGKSPVEYLTEPQRESVRFVAREMFAEEAQTTAIIREIYSRSLPA